MPNPLRALFAASLAGFLLAALAPSAAAYDLCRSPGTGAVGTVTGTMETSGFEWDCEPAYSWLESDGAPDCADRFEIAAGDRVVVTGTLCSPQSPASRRWTVDGRLDLDSSAPVTMHRTGATVFRAGSDGLWRGFELGPGAVPAEVTTQRWDGSRLVDSTAHLALHYGDAEEEGAGLPWSACSEPGCADDSAADTVAPGSHLYFEFETLPSAASGGGDAAIEAPFYEPGAYLEVTSVVDRDADGGLDTLVVQLPTTGPRHGSQHFGADGSAVPLPGGSSEGRCEECLQETPTQTRRGDREGRTKVDTSGFHLRNAVGEPEWTVDSVARVVCERERSGSDCVEGETRFEVRVSDAAFDSDREFEGFLACLPADQEGFALSSERWCGRITGSFDARDPDGDGTSEDVLTVLNDPRGEVPAGAILNVYYLRPVPGQKLVPFNLHTVDGHNRHYVRAHTGSHFGRTTGSCAARPCLAAVHWKRPGPGAADTSLYALWLQSPDQLAVDALLFEHGGSVDAPKSSTKYLVVGQSAESIDDVSRVDLSRVHCRFPEGRTDESNRTSGTVYGHGCIRLVTGDPAGSGAEADVWRGFSARKIRCEGTAQCFLWQAAHYGCQAGQPALQDLYAAHARDWVDDRIPWNLEQIEFQGRFEASCPAAMDRHYSVGHVAGSPIILRAVGLDTDPGDYHTEITSGVVIGCNHGVSACVVGHRGHAEGVHLTDLLIDGGHKIPAGLSYGAQTGFDGGSRVTALPGVSDCQSLRGFVTRGLREDYLNRNTGNCGEGSRIDFADNLILGYAAEGGLALYSLRHGPPPQTLDLRRSVFVCAEGAEECALFDTRIEEPKGHIDRFTIDDALLFTPPGRTASRFLRLRPELFAPGSAQLGPNVHGDADLRCDAFPESEPFVDPGSCELADALARTGEGDDSGVNDASLAEPAPLAGIPLDEVGGLAARSGAALDPACGGEGGPCRPEDALPRWAGPLGRAWPYAVATVDPVPLFERGGPAEGTLPPLLRDRVPECMNGVDDDGDGYVDRAEDPGCATVEDLSERDPTLPCDDGVDNDGDGRVDLEDGGCRNPWGRREASSCGLGFELGIVLPALMALRRRRARAAARTIVGRRASR